MILIGTMYEAPTDLADVIEHANPSDGGVVRQHPTYAPSEPNSGEQR